MTKPDIMEKKEVDGKDFEHQIIDEQEQKEEEMFANYLKIKNMKKHMKDPKKYQQERITTFVDDSMGSMLDIDNKNATNPSQ